MRDKHPIIANETKVIEKYKAMGYEVIRHGAPDFLFFKRNNGKISDVIFVEAKTDGQGLEFHQRAYKNILEELGLKFRVEMVLSGRLEGNKEKFTELWNEGETYEELAKEFGATFTPMHRWRKILRLTERSKQLLIKCEACGEVWNVDKSHSWFFFGGLYYVRCPGCGKKTPNSPIWARSRYLKYREEVAAKLECRNPKSVRQLADRILKNSV